MGQNDVLIDRDSLLAAFDANGAEAAGRQICLELAVYGGAALILASSFRFASEDVDIAPLDPFPPWLEALAEALAEQQGWRRDWLSTAIGPHLSALADRDADHLPFGSFPRQGGPAGLRVVLPTADYLLALKLKALRIHDPAKGPVDVADTQALLKVCHISTPEQAIALLARYFPHPAADRERLTFLLKHLWPRDEDTGDAPPAYPQHRL